MPAYILNCLAEGDSQQQIASRFPEDGELVDLWIEFLRSNHWTEKLDGKWIITKKGQEWINKYDGV